MAEVGMERPRRTWYRRADSGDRAEASGLARERFLTPAMGIGLALFVLFALAFDNVTVNDDGFYYYYFVRDLFGADVTAQAYQFGSAFWTAPFYLASQLVATRGELDHYHAGEIGTTVASNVAAILVLYLGWRLLREFGLPRGPGILLLTLFGTPLLFYAVMRPSYKHVADTLYTTAAFWFLLLASKQPRRRYLVAAGCCLGLMFATRYANLVMPVGVIVMFAGLRAWRSLLWVLTSAAIAGALLFALPVVRGIPYAPQPLPWLQAGARDGPAFGAAKPAVRLASGEGIGGFVHVPGSENVDLEPAAPEKMLFTLHRGLFVWTPLTAFATLGFALLVRRDRRHRWFLVGLAVSAFTLLQVHMIWGGLWDGGGSFSARFLTALFPFYLLGAAEFVRRLKWVGTAVLTVCVVWSLWLGLALVPMEGYGGIPERAGVVEIVRLHSGPIGASQDSLGNFAHKLRRHADRRWTVLRRLVT